MKEINAIYLIEIHHNHPTFSSNSPLPTYYLYQFLYIYLAQASSDKNITLVCTTLSVCISIEQPRGSTESKECLGIDIQDQLLQSQGNWARFHKFPV